MLRGVRQFSSKAVSQDVSGIKVTARDAESPVSKVSVVVKAGARHAQPGTAHLLKNFAFNTATSSKSGLRRWREMELMGGNYNAQLTRENIILSAQFLRTSLPHFVEQIGDVLTNQVYKPHEFSERVLPQSIGESSKFYSSGENVALENVHNLAFRKGLGNPLLVQDYLPIGLKDVETLGKEAFSKSNVEVYATGVDTKDFNDLVEKHFKKLHTGQHLNSEATKFYKGESRTAHAGGNTVALAFPVKSSNTNQVIANLLGGKSAVKWSTGQSPLALAGHKTSTHITADVKKYSDADLLYVTVSAIAPQAVRDGALEAIKIIKSLGNSTDEQINRAIAQTKFAQAESFDSDFLVALSQSEQQHAQSFDVSTVKKAATELTSGPVAYTAVGNVQELPYMDDLL